LTADEQLAFVFKFENGVNVGGAIQYVWMFGIIGVFVYYWRVSIL
jgi:hypothetical protein